MKDSIGNYAAHAAYWDWDGWNHQAEHDYWLQYAARYGRNVLIPMCALGETGAYLARSGFSVTAFDITPEMVAEGRRRFGDTPGLRILKGDVRSFHLDGPPADFCFSTDFEHLSTLEDVKRALVCINSHLRDGGGLVLETTLRQAGEESFAAPVQTFYPENQVYPGKMVWKTGGARYDAETGRFHIAQTFFAQDEDGETDSFDHSFALQRYFREEWLEAFAECGFEVVGEARSRAVESWQSGEGFCSFEMKKRREDGACV